MRAHGRPTDQAVPGVTALAAVLACALLAVPGAGAAWTQAGGDAQHSGRGAPGDLDVVAAFRLAPDGMTLQGGTAGLVDLGDGHAGDGGALLGLARQGNDCRLVRSDPSRPEASPREASAAIPCAQGATLEGYDAGNDLAFVCPAGSSMAPLLQAWPVGGQKAAWTARPRLEAPDPLALPGVDPSAAGVWRCSGLAIGNGRVYVAFASSEGRNRVEALGVTDGEVLWSSTVPSSILLQEVDPALVPTPVQDASGAFRIDGLVLTSTGVVVSGRLDGNNLQDVQDVPPGLAWFSLDGAYRGALVNAPSPAADATGAVTSATLTPASVGSTANGALAAHLVGTELFVVDPQNAQGTKTQLGNPSLGQRELAAPCWSRDTLLVPGESAAFILSATDPASARTWPGLGGGRLQACAIGEAAAWVAVRREDNGTKVDAVRVHLGSGRSLVRLPVPLEAGPAIQLGTHLLPRGDQLVVWDEGGDAALLAPAAAAPAPILTIDDPYATVGAPATVEVQAPAGADVAADGPTAGAPRLLLAWGDGFLEEVGANVTTLSHVYDAAATRGVTLTYVDAQGRTSSARADMLVGTPAPPPRGILEILFEPANQNYTFFTIGLLISAVGAVLAVLGVQRGRRRLDRHLRELERIRDEGRRDPFGAVRELHAFRVKERGLLAKGDLEDAQYTIIEAGAVHTLEILRSRILGTFVGRVTQRFSHALDIALSDGAIDPVEGGALADMASSEPDLHPEERSRLAGLVRSWQRVI